MGIYDIAFNRFVIPWIKVKQNQIVEDLWYRSAVQRINITSHHHETDDLHPSSVSPAALNSFPPFANTEGRNNKMCFLKGRRGEIKAHPALRVTAAPPEPPALAFFCRGSKSSLRGECLPTQTGLVPLSVGRRPPMWGLRWASWGLAAAGALWIKVTPMSPLL